MNERMIELANKANEDIGYTFKLEDAKQIHELMEKFAELIVRECIDKMLNSDDEHFMKLEGWELGGSNHNSWTRGVLDSVAVVREHFGVEE